MVRIKICTSVYMTSFPTSCWGNERENGRETVEDILQSMVISGCCRAIVTVRESPSKMNEDNPNRIDKCAAKRVPASPTRAKHGGLIREMHPMMAPVEF
jgi:hypothetical protein